MSASEDVEVVEEIRYEDTLMLVEEEEDKNKDEKLPAVELFALGVALVSNSLSISSLFPFLKFMVRDMGVSEQDAGNYVGLVASAFMLGRACTSVFWGMFADKFGRKPPILISLASLALLSPLFGLSNSVAMAVCLRFVSGSLNSLIGVGKVVANEIASSHPTHQARAMSVVSISWSTGTILGPGVGGLLTDLYPAYPYLPPMLFISGMCIISLVLTTVYLPETLVKREGTKKMQSPLKLIKNKSVMHPIVVYCLWSMQALGSQELFNLWGGTDRGLGGLGLTPAKLGLVQSVSGLMVLLGATCAMAPLIVYWGPKKLSILGLWVVIPALATMPLLRFVEGETNTMVACCVIFPFFQLGTNFVFTTQFMFINNANPPETRALAQGLSMSLASIAKSMGPILSGTIFAWSVSSPKAYPFNFCLAWYFQAAYGLVALFFTYRLPNTIDSAYQSAPDNET